MINADYFGKFGIVIKKEPDVITFENPGYIRVGKRQMLLGGRSDPRNKALMKMFNMINIGERAGSGVPNILQTWKAEDWIAPDIDEQFNPDRTIIRLSFIKKEESTDGSTLIAFTPTQATQAPTQATQAPAQANKPVATKTVYSLSETELSITSLMKKHPEISQSAIAKKIGVNLNTVKYYVTKLKKVGVIERKGSAQKGQWIVTI